MMTLWLLGVSKPFTFVTVRKADALREQRAMQILNFQETSIVGKSWDTRSLLGHRLTVRV